MRIGPPSWMQQCAGDAELRSQIDSLLRHHHPETVIEPGGRPLFRPCIR